MNGVLFELLSSFSSKRALSVALAMLQAPRPGICIRHSYGAPLTGCSGAEGAPAKPFLQAILSDTNREGFGDCGQIAAQKKQLVNYHRIDLPAGQLRAATAIPGLASAVFHN